MSGWVAGRDFASRPPQDHPGRQALLPRFRRAGRAQRADRAVGRRRRSPPDRRPGAIGSRDASCPPPPGCSPSPLTCRSSALASEKAIRVTLSGVDVQDPHGHVFDLWPAGVEGPKRRRDELVRSGDVGVGHGGRRGRVVGQVQQHVHDGRAQGEGRRDEPACQPRSEPSGQDGDCVTPPDVSASARWSCRAAGRNW